MPLKNDDDLIEEVEGAKATAPRRDFIAIGIFAASLVMLLGIGSYIARKAMGGLDAFAGDADRLLLIAFVLNLALVLFTARQFRRHAQQAEVLAETEERVQTLSSVDPITGLLNRKAFADQGANLISRTVRRSRSVALIMFDVDNFKKINDVHGHAVGDDLLRSMTAELLALAPPHALLGRLGGDEFGCAFVFDPTNRTAVERVAEDVLSKLAQPKTIQGILVSSSSVSIGICANALDCTTIEAMMRRADIAMFSAKHNGRNRFAWFDPAMERELLRRNSLEAAMRNGIDKGEFEPYFEQQIDAVTGALTGFEMLARWNHPAKGVVLPEEFIPIAEETGMIGELSMGLMRRSFEEARNWDPGLVLSVNISPIQLRDAWFAQKLVKLLVETGFPPSRLEIEITETSLYENLQLAQSIVGSLKNQGIRLALDDFGTGYSSLSNLRALPFDRIKIDRSFVTSITDNPESAAIVNAIARLGDSLGLPVTAEGIENDEIARRLKEIGCHKVQGWLYGKPMSMMETRKHLANRTLLSGASVPTTPDIAPAPPAQPAQPVAAPAPLPKILVNGAPDLDMENPLAAFQRPKQPQTDPAQLIVRKSG